MHSWPLARLVTCLRMCTRYHLVSLICSCILKVLQGFNLILTHSIPRNPAEGTTMLIQRSEFTKRNGLKKIG